MRRLKVKNDFIFQRIFGRKENKDILISFLNAIMELDGGNALEDIDIMENTKLDKDRIEDKQGIVDVLAKTVSGIQITIEIQLINQYNMDKRTLFYWAKLFSDQLEEGRPFNDLKKTITINILDFDYIGLSEYHTVFHLWEDRNKDYKLTDVLEIHFVELSKFKKVQPDFKKPIDRWLLFLEDSPKEVLDMAIKEEPAIEKAEKVLEYLGTNEEMIRFYELREKQIHDEITRITGTKLEIAKKMISKGIDFNTISEVTGLTVTEVESLQKN